jgi:integrase
MRKTFAFWLYKDSGGDISMVQEILGHDDPNVTRRYIGINQGRKDSAIKGLKF